MGKIAILTAVLPFYFGQGLSICFGQTSLSTLRVDNESIKSAGSLERLATAAASDKATDQALRKELERTTKLGLHPLLVDKSIPKETRNAIEQLLVKGLNTPQWKRRLIDDTNSPIYNGELSLILSRLKPTKDQQQQVIESHLPSYSLNRLPTGSLSLVANSPAHRDGLLFFSGLRRKIDDNAVAFAKLAESVGRVELKLGSGLPILIGTAFVVDRERGIVATACHVVDEVAKFVGGTWKLPAPQFGESASVLLDFGEKDSHTSNSEFLIRSILFIPTVVGCDGALLEVETNGRRLPPALPLARARPSLESRTTVDVISVGYPDRDLSGATTRTREYFSHLRKDAGDQAKFLMGGSLVGIESGGGYDLLNHRVPTTRGQSGSPVIDISDPGQPQVVGIHICCVTSAQSEQGSPCQWRKEVNPQKAIGMLDLIRLSGLGEP